MAPSISFAVLFSLLLFLAQTQNYGLSLLIPAPPLLLSYHNGPILSGPEPIELFITFYGDFDPVERSTLKLFLSSLAPGAPFPRRFLRDALKLSIEAMSSPSVAKWWSLTQRYVDLHGRHVSQLVELIGERHDDYSLGNNLRASDIASLAASSVEHFSAGGTNSMALIFTSSDVYVEGFCMHSCGGHAVTLPSDESLRNPRNDVQDPSDRMMPYAWVGNSKEQCPGFCAWPFATPQYGPPMAPLKAPNGVGVDGMVITLAKVIVGAATNPFGSGYYQGDEYAFGLEAGGACLSQFGPGGYPGFPGELFQNPATGASYNMEGGGVQFLVPWIWNPTAMVCAGQP